MLAVTLLSACDRSTEEAIEPPPEVSDASANQLMSLAESAAADAQTRAERNDTSARSGPANEQQGDRR
ncbi:hypothetical protein [Sphingomonas arenae]|uniref:hypothetical protein n=1 Tax=Sphingomonas arenae TaxID=2812555 RepID=UPI0019685765|nr:hypothetical protein [Sphingomonas arenae]